MSSLPNWKTIPGPERYRLLADFCAQGLSPQQIADKFEDCSRSAAIGKIHRLKLQLNSGVPRRGKGRKKAGAEALPKNAKPAKPKSAPAPKRTARTADVVSWRGANNPHRNDIKGRAEQRAASPGLPAHLVAGEARKPFEVVGVPVPLMLRLVDLTEQTCKWPVGDPTAEGFGFCGNHASGPYCKYHGRLSYQPATVRQRAGLRSAERIS